MLLPILWFSLLLWPLCDSERECVQCDGRVISPDKTCTNCTGNYCYIIRYNHVHNSLKAEQSFYQGCFTSPTDLPLGCSENSRGSAFCICNNTDYCNEIQNVNNERELSYLTCYKKENSPWPATEDCVHPFCYKKSSSYNDEVGYCTSQEREMEMYDVGFVQTEMFLPLGSCYAVADDSRFDKTQHCVYKTNKTTPFKQKVPGSVKCYAPADSKERMKNSTCVGQFCFSANSAYGCISQFNREGPVLKVGLHRLTPFLTPFQICDSDFCNNQTIPDDEEDRYKYPTRYVWSSGRRPNFVGILVIYISSFFIGFHA
ncbi:unnamed protein product [Caenorhabditis nigoni]